MAVLCCVQVAEARKLLTEGEIEKSLNSARVVAEALRAAQQDGIVFIDEIDKIVETSRGVSGATSMYSTGTMSEVSSCKHACVVLVQQQPTNNLQCAHLRIKLHGVWLLLATACSSLFWCLSLA